MASPGSIIRSATAAQIILQAACQLDEKNNGGEFTEFDLTVEAWNLDKLRFGLRGYAHQHPDHKRVSMEIMGKKGSSPVQRKYLEKVRPNVYRVTSLGRSVGRGMTDNRSASRLLTIRLLSEHKAFRSWLNDPSLPYLATEYHQFLGTLQLDDPHDRTGQIKGIITEALSWCTAHRVEYLSHYSHSSTVHVNTIVSLQDFLSAMEQRFPFSENGKKSPRH